MDMLVANCDLSVTQTRKVSFAMQQLRGHALLWWQARFRGDYLMRKIESIIIID
jgi:hypothetical protein